MYLIFFPFSVSLGSATDVLEAGASSAISLAAALTAASLVLDGIASEVVLEAIAEVDIAVVVENADVGILDSEIEVGSGVGVGPAGDMDVAEIDRSEEVMASEDVVEVVMSMSASEYSVGESC